MKYANTYLARFIDRPNRFVAHCRLEDSQEVVTVHVKNTGRTTILQPNVTVALVKSDNPKRKTLYDLVAAKKYDRTWINVDSQAPNVVVKTGLETNYIQLPGIAKITKVLPETTFLDSRIDFMGFDDQDQPFFLEVKGVTLMNEGVAAFPDAPTDRGRKHVHTLEKAMAQGYKAYLLFVCQMQGNGVLTIYDEMDPKLSQAIDNAQHQGLNVVAYDCQITPDTMTLAQKLPFDLKQPFVSDGLPSSITPKQKKI